MKFILGLILSVSFALAAAFVIVPKGGTQWDDDCVRGDIGCEFE